MPSRQRVAMSPTHWSRMFRWWVQSEWKMCERALVPEALVMFVVVVAVVVMMMVVVGVVMMIMAVVVKWW